MDKVSANSDSGSIMIMSSCVERKTLLISFSRRKTQIQIRLKKSHSRFATLSLVATLSVYSIIYPVFMRNLLYRKRSMDRNSLTGKSLHFRGIAINKPIFRKWKYMYIYHPLVQMLVEQLAIFPALYASGISCQIKLF